ncbi:hypothetical protein [Streptomyces olivaceoviridis]|uniref:hypothetical protein n=1 Tax=Streptomyces olivaceoviridis TaxID=1921 RepID=UPI0036916A0C
MAQTNNPTNSPYQHDLVEYTAYGNRGFELAGWLGNPAAGVRTAHTRTEILTRTPEDTPAR